MKADTSSKSLMRGWPGLPYVVMIAAAATVAVLIALVAAQTYPAAIVVVLSWTIVAAVAVIGSLAEAARDRLAATILVVWFVTAPVAWFFIRFPLEKSIVTYERLVFGLVGVLGLARLLRSKPNVEPGSQLPKSGLS